jgi:UDP-N-acetylmuramoyl-tripeptide--D-alanyl-D-alanine ligase
VAEKKGVFGVKHFTLGFLKETVSGRLIPEDASLIFASGVSTDSRTIKPGQVFFALKGERFDGHNFVADAIKAGAICCVVSRNIPGIEPVIIVNDTLEALGALAKKVRSEFNFPVVAISGSVGKSSTKELITGILSKMAPVVSSPESYNNLIGLPLTILNAQAPARFAVLELGINREGEMDKLVAIASPEIAVLTSISAVHTEGLKSVEGVLNEKIKLIEGIKDSGIAFVNGDYEILLARAKKTGKKIISYGTTDKVDIKASDIKWDASGVRFTIEGNRFFMPVLGRFWVYSALPAYCVGRHFGSSISDIESVFASFKNLKGRMVRHEKNGIIIIDDTYNANPLATREALLVLYGLKSKRRFAILGDMLELGELTPVAHREIGRLVAELNLDGAYFVGNFSSASYQSARENGLKNTEHFVTPEEFLSHLHKFQFSPGDTILVKGSRKMRMENIVSKLLEVI